ncbi:MAG: hypothetical protein WCF36_22250 [Candidatus Nanopelagicales bacterium]
MTEPTEPLTGMERRLSAAAEVLLDRVPPDVRAECEALIELDPSCAGVRMHYEPDLDLYALTWVGRWLGSLPGPWLRDGIDPDNIGGGA